MKIAICDDELTIHQQMKNVLLSYFSDKLIDAEIYDYNKTARKLEDACKQLA